MTRKATDESKPGETYGAGEPERRLSSIALRSAAKYQNVSKTSVGFSTLPLMVTLRGRRPEVWRVDLDFLLGRRSPHNRSAGPEDFLLAGTMGGCENTVGERQPVRTISIMSESSSESESVVKSYMTPANDPLGVETRVSVVLSELNSATSESACGIFRTRR